MGIYFGNLDRQLADRQQVLKEDAERQYRGCLLYTSDAADE